MRITDSQALFRPTYRLVLCCILVGLLGALAALAFDFLVDWAQKLLLGGIGHYPNPEITSTETRAYVPQGLSRLWLPLVTTLGGLLSGWLVCRWAPEAEGHGTDAVIAAYHRRGAEVRGRIPLVKAVASALTIGSGGVAGREGPTAQIAVGLGTSLARWAGLRGQERRSRYPRRPPGCRATDDALLGAGPLSTHAGTATFPASGRRPPGWDPRPGCA